MTETEDRAYKHLSEDLEGNDGIRAVNGLLKKKIDKVLLKSADFDSMAILWRYIKANTLNVYDPFFI